MIDDGVSIPKSHILEDYRHTQSSGIKGFKYDIGYHLVMTKTKINTKTNRKVARSDVFLRFACRDILILMGTISYFLGHI